jgi:hypothetical protein
MTLEESLEGEINHLKNSILVGFDEALVRTGNSIILIKILMIAMYRNNPPLLIP